MEHTEALPISSTFAVRCASTQMGDRVVLVGAPPCLGSWEPSRGVELTTDEAAFPVYTSPVVVCPTPGFVEYKFVRITPAGTCMWEQGSNRLKNMITDEHLDCGVFQENVLDASNQQLVEAINDHERIFSLLPSVSELCKLEEQVDHLHGVIASMRSQNLRLTWALTASQSEVESLKGRLEEERAMATTPTAFAAAAAAAGVAAPSVPAAGSVAAAGSGSGSASSATAVPTLEPLTCTTTNATRATPTKPVGKKAAVPAPAPASKGPRVAGSTAKENAATVL